jgi:hypothetical protein
MLAVVIATPATRKFGTTCGNAYSNKRIALTALTRLAAAR